MGMEYMMNIDDSSHTVFLPDVLGAHQAFAPAFALGVASVFDVPLSDALTELEGMEVTPGRMRIIEGKQGSVIIDDSYNSSPTALQAALVTLGTIETKAGAKKIAIIGDMRELGDKSDAEHRRAGAQAAHIVDELYTVGPEAEKLAHAAIEEGLSEEKVHIFDTKQATDVGKTVAKIVREGDIILVKSSQGQLRLEKAIKEIMQHPDNASRQLVRQEKEWIAR